MQISVWLTWEVKVDDHVDGNDVDTTGKYIRGDQASCLTSLEVVEDSKIDKLLESLAKSLDKFDKQIRSLPTRSYELDTYLFLSL